MRFSSLEPRESAVDACAASVRQAILRGELRAGERLPPERELAESLGVSRLTLRAGLGKLASTGLLSVKHGSGYLVQDFHRTGGVELLPGLAALTSRREELAGIAADLLRVRRHLATAVLQQIAEKPKRGVDRRVGAVIDAFEALVRTGTIDRQRIAEADLDIVAALIAETGSAVMALCLNPVVMVVAEIAPLRDAIYAAPEHNLLGWRALQAWLSKPSVASVARIVALLEENDRATVQRLGEARSPRGGRR